MKPTVWKLIKMTQHISGIFILISRSEKTFLVKTMS